MLFAVDFETHLFSPGNMAPRPIVLSWWPEATAAVPLAAPGVDRLKSLLEGGHGLVGAHIAYDMAVAMAADSSLIPLVYQAYDGGRIHDVLIRQKLIEIAMGQRKGLRYNLQSVYKRLTGLDLEKEDTPRTEYHKVEGIPIEQWPQEYIQYAVDDSRVTYECYAVQQNELEADGVLEVLGDEAAQCRAALALQLASVWGLRTDAKGVAQLRKWCEDRLEQIWPGLRDIGLMVESGGERKRKIRAAQERMLWAHDSDFDRCKLTKTGYKKKKQGDEDWDQVKYVSVDAEACKESGDSTLEQYAEYTQVASLLNGHVKAVEQGIRTPLHTRFDSLKETGRTGSSKQKINGEDHACNTQNVRKAKGARECFVPREGWAFIACDYSQAELYTLSQICKDLFGESVLGDALNSGIDPHLQLGAQLNGFEYGEALALKKAKDPRIKTWRASAKPANFGLPGGMGWRGLQKYAKGYDLVWGDEQAQEIYHAWREAWPVVSQQYLGYIARQTKEGSMTVVHHRSNRWRGGCPFTVAANSHFQGLAADGAKAAMYEVSKACYSIKSSPLYGCRPVNFIHDEVLLEARLEQVAEAGDELSRVMVDTFNRYTPDYPVSAEPAAMDRWSKKAEEIRDKDGRLQVWHYEEAA